MRNSFFAFVARENQLDKNMDTAYTVVLDMCTEELQAKIKAVTTFKTEIKDKLDVIKLLEEIRNNMYNF